MTRYTIRGRHYWGGGYVWMRESRQWRDVFVWMRAHIRGVIPSTDDVVYPLYGGVAIAMRRDWGSPMRCRTSLCPRMRLGKQLGDNTRAW